MCIIRTSLIYELMVEIGVEEVVGGSNDMHVVIVGNVDHDDVTKKGPKVTHPILHKKKRLEIDNKVWWELVAKVQSIVDDEKNEFSENNTNEDVSKGGHCLGFSYICLGMTRIVCTCYKEGSSLMMCLDG